MAVTVWQEKRKTFRNLFEIKGFLKIVGQNSDTNADAV